MAHAVRLFGQAASDARAAWQPQLPLELAFLEAALPEETAGPTEMSAGKETVPRREMSPPPAPSPARATGRPAAPPARPSPGATPPPASPPVREPPPPEPVAEFSLEEVTQRWNDLLRILRSVNHSLEALMRSGKPISVEGGALLIGFPYSFHRDKVDEEANRRAVEDALTQLLGRPVRVRCVLLAGSGGRSSSRPAAARPPTPQPRTSPPAPPSPPPSPPADDGLVQAAVEKLGARVAKRE